MFAAKVVVISVIASIPLVTMYHVKIHLLFALIALVVVLTARSNFMSALYLQLETRFLRNLNERIIAEEEKKEVNSHGWTKSCESSPLLRRTKRIFWAKA